MLSSLFTEGTAARLLRVSMGISDTRHDTREFLLAMMIRFVATCCAAALGSNPHLAVRRRVEPHPQEHQRRAHVPRNQVSLESCLRVNSH